MSAPPTHYQRQTWGDARSAYRRPLLAADKAQDWPASCRAGIMGVDAPNQGRGLRASGYRNSHRADSLPARGRVHRFDFLLPIEQGIRPTHYAERLTAARVIHSAQVSGSSRRPAQFLPAQQILQSLAHRFNHHNRLSSSASLSGSNNASKWSQGRDKVSQELGRFGQGRPRHD